MVGGPRRPETSPCLGSESAGGKTPMPRIWSNWQRLVMTRYGSLPPGLMVDCSTVRRFQ